jgi:hypothetical protein
MASAGVVGAAEVFSPMGTPSGGFTGSPAMWAFTWVGFAALVLVFLHLAMVGRSNRLWNT